MAFGDFPPSESGVESEKEARPRVPRRSVALVALGTGLFLSGIVLGAVAPNFLGRVSGEPGLARNAALIGEAFRASVFGAGEAGRIVDIPLHGTGDSDAARQEGDVPGKDRELVRLPGSAPAGGGSGNAETKEQPKKEEEIVQSSVFSSSTLPAEYGTSSASLAECSWASASFPTHEIVVSEVAWMGSPAESASQGSANEWFEVRNPGGTPFPLRGTRVFLGSGSGMVLVSSSVAIPPLGFALFERSDDSSVPNTPADGIFTGSLSNAGGWLRLFGSDCRLLDEVDARAGWFAGEASAKKTMARRSDLSWFTSVEVGGTPRRENTLPSGGAATSTQSIPSSAAPPTTPTALRTLTVSVLRASGATGGVLGSGIDCSAECTKTLAQGTELALTAAPGAGSVFVGWSGACMGTGSCALALAQDASVTAEFAVLPPSPPAPPVGGVVIMEVMVGSDGAAADEFIELFNAGTAAADLTGWTVKKRSSTGSEGALVAASRLAGKSIPPGKRFLLGNEGGYAGAVSLDASWASSNVLAYANNAVLLYDATGVKVDEAAWTDIPPGSSIARSAPGAVFEASAVPTPEHSTQ